MLRAKTPEQWSICYCILGKRAEQLWIIGVLRKSSVTTMFHFCWRLGEELNLLTAAQIWRGQTSWVQTDSLARSPTGTQITPRGDMESVCVCVNRHKGQRREHGHTLFPCSVTDPRIASLQQPTLKSMSPWVLIDGGAWRFNTGVLGG